MIHWLSTHPGWYWGVAWSTFAVLVASAVGPIVASFFSPTAEERMLRRFPRWFVGAAAIACFVAFRWPVWYVPWDLNPDEGQIVAEAITLQHRALFWGAADGATHGPLDAFALLPLRWFGLKIDFFGARVVVCIMMLLVVAGCYRAFAVFARESLARVAALPVFCVLAFNSFSDWVHYSSEQVPMALLAVAFWLIVADLERSEGRRVWSLRWIVAGLACGGVPMAKLQGAPIAAALMAGAAVFDLCARSIGWRDRWQRVLILGGAGLVPTLFFAVVTYAFGAWPHAWISYVRHNIEYAEKGDYTFGEMLAQIGTYFGRTWGAVPFFVGSLILVGLTAVTAISASRRALKFVAMGLIFLLSSAVAVFAPCRQPPHYLLFMVAPTGVCAGAIWLAVWEGAHLDAALRARRQKTLLVIFMCICVLPQVVERAVKPHPNLGQLATITPFGQDSVTKEIHKYARPGESLGMWGWMCRYYVSAGMWQATRDGHSYTEITPGPLQNYFRWRYLHDLQRNRPPVFVDAVGPGNFRYTGREVAHESFPELRDYIAREYRQVADLAGCRIYVRIDRLR